jgi:DNA-binding protein Fis
MNQKFVKKTKTSSTQQVVKDAVSNKLKAYYDDISRQDVPQRFLDLLKDLDKAGEGSE